MDDLTEIYIYIYLSGERVSNNDVYNDCFLGPSFLEKITCKKKKTKRKCREILEEKLEIYFKTPFSLFL